MMQSFEINLDREDEMKTLRILITVFALACVFASGAVAQQQSKPKGGSNLAGNCKAFCEKNWPGNAGCLTRCATKNNAKQ